MLILKSLGFILWNIALGLSLVYLFKWFLFNTKARYIFGKRIPFTPGFLVAKREWVFSKARDILHDYLEQAADPDRSGYLRKWLKQIRVFLWEKTEFVQEWRFLPAKLKQSIRSKIVDAFVNLAGNLLRKTVPRMIEQLRVEHRIDDFDFQFSIDFFYGYFRKYVYKPMLIAFLAVNFLIGIMNMIFFLIVV
ncbi:MAG: hypothetical protein CVU50_09070 [Candidatus Cloacimonetes bacterium HGW-Cloacimonetes-3]|jgi:uncharacterized membrane protein YheB (UPF0754 family)|nr:MAG: hypothetical protein CVU50_09070 [Candidatus Cloacimonetes bacterium HGW-Cloacimonetes-3]